MYNSLMRSKPKRNNLSQGGQDINIPMQIQQQSFDNNFFFKDNKSWYDCPMLPFSPQISRKHSNIERQMLWQNESDRLEENDVNQVRSYVQPSHSHQHKNMQNKSESSRLQSIISTNSSTGCKCTKVNCLKRTCGCFDNGKHCGLSCVCKGCKNVEENKSLIERSKVEAKLRSNRSIFEFVEHEVPIKVCTCKKSRCMKGYCECYQEGVGCNEFCKCVGCMNIQGRKKGEGSTVGKSSKQKSIDKEI